MSWDNLVSPIEEKIASVFLQLFWGQPGVLGDSAVYSQISQNTMFPLSTYL